MSGPVIVIAPIKLKKGKTEADLLAASNLFQENFVANEPGVFRRELVAKEDGSYLDIILFRSERDYLDVTNREMESPDCAAFFSVMDIEGMEDSSNIEIMPLLATYL